ncbi:MAG: sigma-70 family RNA polymerase sigma factor [Actinomycetota bacterium]|nr:sigma-70 family RNA polymerase sigma factor [Actinomycetota bacterium]
MSRDDGRAPRTSGDDANEDGRECDPRPTFDEVVEQYGPKIYRTALRLTGNLDDAADLSQDVFLRIYGSLDRYEPGTFDGWLYRVTKNLFLDRARRRVRLRMEPLPDEEWRVPASGEPGPADVLERRTLEATLENGLAQLTADFRLAVVLCDVEGLTYDEIADITGWPLGTVRSRIHRGRRALRDFLALQPPPTDGAPDHARAARSRISGPLTVQPQSEDPRNG